MVEGLVDFRSATLQSYVRAARSMEARRAKIRKLPRWPSGGVPPVPIPNTEVKPSSADNTDRATGWEDRSPPGFFYL